MHARALLVGYLGIWTLFSAPSATAAILRTTDGAERTVDLAAESLHLETDAGAVEVPLAAILQAKRIGSRFELLLADGTKLEGTFVEEALKVREGLVLKAVPTAQIEILMLTPAGFPLGSLESNYFPVGLYKGTDLITTCPIRLEVDATRALQAGGGDRVAIARTGYFTCDSLSLVALSLSLDRGKRSARVTFAGTIRVLESHDKFAQLGAELLAGSKSLGRAQGQRVDAEEKKATPFKLALEVPTDALDAALAGTEALRARITVEVSRN